MNTSEKLSKTEAAVIKMMLQKQDAVLPSLAWDHDTAKRVFLGDGWPTSFTKWQAAARYLAQELPRGFMAMEAEVQLKWKQEADFDILRGDFTRPPVPGTEFIPNPAFKQACRVVDRASSTLDGRA